MKCRLIKLIGNIRGATAIEYGLILGLIAVVMIAGLSMVGNSNNGGWGNVATNISNSLPSS